MWMASRPAVPALQLGQNRHQKRVVVGLFCLTENIQQAFVHSQARLHLKHSELCQEVKGELTAGLVILAHGVVGYAVEDRHKGVEVWVNPSLAHLQEQL